MTEERRLKQRAAEAAYRDRNRKKICDRSKEYHIKNRERINIRNKERYLENRELKLKKNKEWVSKNRTRYNATKRKRHKERMKNDKLYAIKVKLREVVRTAFCRLKQQKPANTEKILGCTWTEAVAHIESLFREGMTWSNHGQWHIDHIRPVSSFTLEDVHLMNHITNLQPLWAKENLRKYNHYSP